MGHGTAGARRARRLPETTSVPRLGPRRADTTGERRKTTYSLYDSGIDQEEALSTANGEAPARRRRGRGRKQPSTPADIGTVLLRARQALGLGLVDVRDRTGVSLAVLEALETGDLTQAPSHEAAIVGLRRYADLVNLDGEDLVRSLEPYWRSASLVGAASGPARALDGGSGGPAGPGPAPAPAGGGFAGHLRRYPDEGNHLQAFTQTAQTAAVSGSAGVRTGVPDLYGSSQVFGQTGMYPATPPLRIRQVVRPAAWPVRFLVWTTVVALVVAGAGLVVAHVRPQWMRDVHLAKVPPSSPRTAAGAPAPTGTTPPRPKGPPSVVSTGVPGPTGTPITVQAAAYTVLVTTTARCWIQVTTPASLQPVLNTILPAGSKQVLTPVDGQVTVQLGASGVLLAVQVLGKVVPGWSLAPDSAPITYVFSNSPAP